MSRNLVVKGDDAQADETKKPGSPAATTGTSPKVPPVAAPNPSSFPPKIAGVAQPEVAARKPVPAVAPVKAAPATASTGRLPSPGAPQVAKGPTSVAPVAKGSASPGQASNVPPAGVAPKLTGAIRPPSVMAPATKPGAASPPVIAGPPPAAVPVAPPASSSIAEILSASIRGASPAAPTSSVLWPRDVPNADDALPLITATVRDSTWESTTQRLIASLTQVESNALMGRPSPLDLTALRNAIVIRWRLSAALEMKPLAGAPIDGSALEQLLGEADVALSKLQTPEGATESSRAGFATCRGALAKDAVALSEIAAEIAQRAASDAVTVNATQKYQHVARIVAAGADTAKTALRSKVMWIAMAVTLLGALGFHGYRYLKASNQRDGRFEGAPEGMDGFKNDKLGVTVLHSIDPSKPMDPVVIQKLKEKAEATGSTLHEVAPGQYIIAPSSMNIPNGPSPKTAGTP